MRVAPCWPGASHSTNSANIIIVHQALDIPWNRPSHWPFGCLTFYKQWKRFRHCLPDEVNGIPLTLRTRALVLLSRRLVPFSHFWNFTPISQIIEPIQGMFVLILFQIWSWNSTILTFFSSNCFNFLTCRRLHSPAAWKALIMGMPFQCWPDVRCESIALKDWKGPIVGHLKFHYNNGTGSIADQVLPGIPFYRWPGAWTSNV